MSASDQALRQKPAEESVRPQTAAQHQRQIAEIALAEDNVLKRAEIAQAGAAVIKDVFAAFESAVDIAGQKFLQDRAADAVVEQAVVAAVERPHAAEEARIVDGDDQQPRAR